MVAVAHDAERHKLLLEVNDLQSLLPLLVGICVNVALEDLY